MEAPPITIQTFFSGEWHSAAKLSFPGRGLTHITYLNDYLEAQVDSFLKSDERAISEVYPLNYELWKAKVWPAFVLDIMPSGAARRWWKRRLAAHDLTESELDLRLLREHTSSPIGHLRVLESVQEHTEPIAFTKEEVVGRDTGFLEYAAEHGAALGGATGAGGDAPKVLLVEDAKGNVYPEGALLDKDVVKSWLVKWPRGKNSPRDQLVLRTEYFYAKVLAENGFDIRPGEIFDPEDGKPCVWFPRFDRSVTSTGLERRAVESFYSLAGVSEPGAVITHETYLRSISNALKRRGQPAQMKDFVIEIIKRELLNVVLGNSDNHGRNSAVLRSQNLALAPIFDLAPMVMDPEGITRSTRWERAERAGSIAWQSVFDAVSEWVSKDEVECGIREFATSLLPLPDLLKDAGVADEVLSFPRIYLRNLPDQLATWGLL